MTRRLSEPLKVFISYSSGKGAMRHTYHTINAPFLNVSLSGLLVLFHLYSHSLDKVTIISYLDDSCSLLIGLFVPKCSSSTPFPQYGQTDPSKSQTSPSHYPALKNLQKLLTCYSPQSWSMSPCLSCGGGGGGQSPCLVAMGLPLSQLSTYFVGQICFSVFSGRLRGTPEQRPFLPCGVHTAQHLGEVQHAH